MSLNFSYFKDFFISCFNYFAPHFVLQCNWTLYFQHSICAVKKKFLRLMICYGSLLRWNIQILLVRTRGKWWISWAETLNYFIIFKLDINVAPARFRNVGCANLCTIYLLLKWMRVTVFSQSFLPEFVLQLNQGINECHSPNVKGSNRLNKNKRKRPKERQTGDRSASSVSRLLTSTANCNLCVTSEKPDSIY